MMELRNVSAGYQGRPVVQQVNLHLERGSLTVLVGPNGSGKSTLLRAMAGLIPPLSGEIWLQGQAAARFTPRQWARRVAMLPQTRSVPALTAGQLVMHGRYPYLGFPRTLTAQDRQAVCRALERVGADGLAGRPMQALSGGERQRVYLAMLLAQQAEMLLLDEPATYLDIGHQLEMLGLIPAVLGHHERWDGKGYPRGIAGVLHLRPVPGHRGRVRRHDHRPALSQGQVLRGGSLGSKLTLAIRN